MKTENSNKFIFKYDVILNHSPFLAGFLLSMLLIVKYTEENKDIHIISVFSDYATYTNTLETCNLYKLYVVLIRVH